MKKILFWAALLGHFTALRAHPMPNTLVELTVSPGGLLFELKIPLNEVHAVVFADKNDPIRVAWPVLSDYLVRHLKVTGADGRAWPAALSALDTLELEDPLLGRYAELLATVRVTPPAGADLRQFVLHYDAILHQVVTHQAILRVKQDWANGVTGEQEAPSLAVIQVAPETGEILPVAVSLAPGSASKGTGALFALGCRHIAAGTDHLMFLLLLLLIAPLQRAGSRWGGYGGLRFGLSRLFKIVTAFTLGHSATLAVCSLGYIGFSSRWVEVAIAFSILISAVHALRPLFFGRELWVACAFGLIHGMAFSDTLRQLHLDTAQLLWSLLGFNLGIEAVQLALVALTAPLFFWGATTRYYPVFRFFAGAAGCLMAVVWMWERMGL